MKILDKNLKNCNYIVIYDIINQKRGVIVYEADNVVCDYTVNINCFDDGF